MDDITINENLLNTTILNLQKYRDNISNNLNNERELFSKISSCIEGEIGDSIKNKLSQFDIQFDLLLENLESFIEDFKNVVIAFKEQDSSITLKEVETDKGGETINVRH